MHLPSISHAYEPGSPAMKDPRELATATVEYRGGMSVISPASLQPDSAMRLVVASSETGPHECRLPRAARHGLGRLR